MDTTEAFNEERYKEEFKIGDFERPRIEKIIDIVPTNKKILDIGCYDGTISQLIKEKNNVIIGLDMSMNALNMAKKKGIECVLSNAENLPFRDASFDIIVASEIIEHIFDTGKFLDEINRILKSNGELILTTPNLALLDNRFRLLLGLQPHYCEIELEGNAGHIRCFTKKSFKNLIEKHGFMVEKIQSDILFIPVLNAILRKIGLNKKLGDTLPGLGTILIFKAKNINNKGDKIKMTSLNNGTKEYFRSKGTVSNWWNVDKGHLSFHYNKELQVLDENFTVNPAWNVLDIGTGKGRFAIYFAKKGCKVTALDISEEMLTIAGQNAKKEGVSDKITFILGDAEDLSKLNKEYDVVCCMETLDHLPDSKKAIQEMSGRIKSKGYFLFTYVPDSSIYWIFYWNILLRKRVGIARAYSDNYILNLFKRNNIIIQNRFGVGLIFPIGPLILRIPLHILARFEKLIKSYYVRPSFVRRCTHIVGWGIKEDLMKTKEVNFK